MKEKNVVKDKRHKKKYRIKYKLILVTFFFLYFLFNVVYKLVNMPISNIYISGNNNLTDWEVIKLASLDDYPPTLFNSSNIIEKRLEKNNLIYSANVAKKKFTIVYIDITENRPLFYDQIHNKTVLMDKTSIDKKYIVPILNSTIDKKSYDKFIEGMKNIPKAVLIKMSEITYSPDDVDKEKYLITMTDGNYVYITLDKFNLINDYNDMVQKLNNKKGIFFLNSGGYFKVM